jgi:SAM-dependent methyltransferase
MLNKNYYTKDAMTAFLEPESVDLFVTHPPYFNLNSENYGNVEEQLQRTSVPNVYVDNLMKVVKHMEIALKPTGSIVIGIPTNEILYKLITKISTETKLNFGPSFFWDFSGNLEVVEAEGVDSNLILTLYKTSQYVNKNYKPKSPVISVPWLVTEELNAMSHIAFVNDAIPEEICDIMINQFSKPGDVVADLLAGTGTVLKVAKKLNRQIIYNDVSEEQTKLAKMIIDNEKETKMDLRRKEVIALMTKEIQDMNVKQMQKLSMPSSEIQEYIDKSGYELDTVNTMLFNLLVKHGVIR